MKVLVAWFLFVVVAIADARCASPTIVRAESRGGQWQVTVKHDGKFEFARKSAKGLKVQSKASIEVPGHHPSLFVSNSGRRFVIVDPYAGVAIYDQKGAIVKRYEPNDLLTENELENRPGKWTCHPEGTCVLGTKVERDGVLVSLSNGKKVRLERI